MVPRSRGFESGWLVGWLCVARRDKEAAAAASRAHSLARLFLSIVVPSPIERAGARNKTIVCVVGHCLFGMLLKSRLPRVLAVCCVVVRAATREGPFGLFAVLVSAGLGSSANQGMKTCGLAIYRGFGCGGGFGTPVVS